MMILATLCTIASFETQKGAKNIALEETAESGGEFYDCEENILIPVNNLETTDELINLSVTVKSKHNKNGLFALNVINDNLPTEQSDKRATKLLEKASIVAASTDNYLHKLLRYEPNIAFGIIDVVKEHNISDIIFGIHHKQSVKDSFLGDITEHVISKSNTTIMIYRSTQPLATIHRHIIVVPENAEKEIGFSFWLIKVWNIARNTGAKIVFYAHHNSIKFIEEINKKHPIEASFVLFDDWNKIPDLKNTVKSDDCITFIMSRKENVSYNSIMRKIPNYLDNEFAKNCFIMVYPLQMGVADDSTYDYLNPTMVEPVRSKLEKIDEIGSTIVKIFAKK
ncbi:hypothetical protein MASR1M45_31660 [Candidatus Kapaibacterium sp.]